MELTERARDTNLSSYSVIYPNILYKSIIYIQGPAIVEKYNIKSMKFVSFITH